MYRMKLAVADGDEQYLKSFCSFVNDDYRRNVRVVSFASIETLKEYLLSGEKVDVLLAGPDFICSEANGPNVCLTVLLSENGECRTGQFPSLNKYQHGDIMLGQLVDLFLSENKDGERLYAAGGNTRVVSVYSACGGVGKSTVAINMAVQASLMGNSVFYLNLEPFSSSLNVLSGQGDRCLSNILLHAHEDSLLPAKIQSFSVRDMKYNVDFFLPPESSAELSELDRQSTANLLLGMRRVGIYDLIIVDTEPALNQKNIAVLEDSDGVVLLYTLDGICIHKMGVMLEDLKKENLNLDHKIIQVINKYSGERGFSGEHSADFRIPLVEDEVLKNERTGFMEFTSHYASHILSLTKVVLGP